MNPPKGLGSVDELLKRFKSSGSRFEQWRSLHQEAFDFAAPQRETFTVHAPGQRKNRFVYDSTAVNGLQQFASRIQGSMIPSWQQWMNLVAGDEIPKEQKEAVDKALKDATDTFFSHLNHSNFDTEITPSLLDLGVGTGCILIEENDFDESSALKFTNIPLAELYIEIPARGAVKNVWRKQKVTAANIKQTWPNATIPDDLAKIIDKDPMSDQEIINGMLFNADSKKYDQVVLWEKHLIHTQSFDKKRMIVFRWAVTPGEAYGRGPVIQTLPDIRTANKIVEITLGNAALQMTGLYTGRSDGIFNPHTVRIAPGSIIPVASNDNSNPSIRALTPSGNLGIADGMLEMMQNNIRKALFSDPLGELTDPVRSATENVIRNQEFLKQSGASIGRLKSELVEPLVNACVSILVERGKIPELVVDGKEVTIRQLSPLAKAEDTEQFQNTSLWINTLGAILPPEVLALSVKVEELPRIFQEQLGVTPELIRSDVEKKQMSDAAQQVTQAAETGLEQGL
ncbi:MAG: portal protein [Emcibacteraceae bacterium]|nr:portal protein [Emcibacteraceae bacterium]